MPDRTATIGVLVAETEAAENFIEGWSGTGPIKTAFTGSPALFRPQEEPFEDFVPQLLPLTLDVSLDP